MSHSSRKSAPKKIRQVDRPFEPKILERAQRLAREFRVLLEETAGDGFIGKAIEMPECVGTGQNADDCVAATRELLTSALATMIEAGEVPPLSSKQQTRNEQVNIRITADEKLLLEEASKNKGFRGLSDFLRSTALSSLR